MSAWQRTLLWIALTVLPAAAQRLNEANAAQLADRLLLEDHPVLVAPSVQDAIQRLGETLVESSGNPEKLRFTFTVLNDPVPNGFSFPGGYIYVTSGLLSIARSRDEAAAVLAHEVAHVNAEHLTRTRNVGRFSSQPRYDVPDNRGSRPPSPGTAAAGVVGVLEVASRCAAAPVICGAVAILSLFATDTETESFNEVWADELAVSYLRKAGFDTNGLMNMVDTLGGGWHRDWPAEKQRSSEERIWNIRRLITSQVSGKSGR